MEYVTCNLCDADDTTLVYPSTLPDGALDTPDPGSLACTNSRYGVHPPIVRCRRCGLMYANPRREASVLLNGYDHVVDETYVKEREGRVLTFRRHLQPIEKLVGSGTGKRLLDVGCHIGIFLEIAAERGWDAWGVEPSFWSVSQARDRGLKVTHGTLRQAAFDSDFFDVVTLWDVIEHLPDPRAELLEVARVLRPGGLLAVHTMDVSSLFARLMGAFWPWLMEMHLYYFSRRTLSALLARTGFEVIRIRAQGRFLRLGYLLSRLEPYGPRLASGLSRIARALRIEAQPVPINLGDLITAYGRKRWPHPSF